MPSLMTLSATRRQLAEFFVNQGEQFVSRFGVAALEAVKDASDIAHASQR